MPKDEIRTAVNAGRTYKFVAREGYSPSWDTHTSEANIRQAWWNVSPGDIVFDAGAALGSYSLDALAAGAAHCFCVTPEDYAPLLRDNLDVNGWYKKATIYECGLWSQDGYLDISGTSPKYFEDKPTSWNQVKPSGAFFVTTIDKIVAREEISRLEWLKLDVEGAEAEILKGAEKTLSRFHPDVLVENHLFKSSDIKNACAKILAELGYREVGTIPYDYAVSHSFYTPA